MSLDSDQIIKLYLNRLVKSLIPIEFGQEYIDSIYNDMYRFLIGGGNTSSYDLNNVVNQYKTVFLSQGFRNEWSYFQETLNALLTLKSKDQVASYLVFFNTLKGNNTFMESGNSAVSANATPFSSIKLDSNTNERNRRNSILSDNNSRFSGFQHSENRSSFQPALSQTSTANNMNYSNIHTMNEVIQPYYKSLSEQEILKYLSFTLLGSNSAIFTFTNNNDNLVLPPNINNSYTGLLHKILEPALIYKKLVTFIEWNKGKNKSPIKNAYLSILNSELNNYMRFVNTLFSSTPSSLLYVYNHIHNQVLKLRFIFHLTSKFEFNGSDFLSEIYNYTQYEDSLIKKLSKSIFQYSCKPYYEILENWLLNGELIDINDEFFIFFRLENKDLSIINFDIKKVPKFFPDKICEKIFHIGKLIIFLKNYCNELDWLNSYNLKYSKLIYDSNAGLVSLSISQLTTLIDHQYNDLVKYNNFVIYNKFKLINHLKNFKNFLLMGKNDFVECIITNGVKLFNEPSNNLNSYQLTRILQDSINQSSIKNLDQEYQQRLDARILDLSHGNIGWQVFTLEYKIDKPLEVLVNCDRKLLDYLKLFNFLWKLKKIEYLLTTNWQTSSKIFRNDLQYLMKKLKRRRKLSNTGDIYYLKIEWLIDSAKKLNLIRNNFLQFIKVLLSHLLFNVIEHNSKILFKALRSKHKEDNGTNVLLPPNKSKLQNLMSQQEFDIGYEDDLNFGNDNIFNNEYNLDELIKIHSDYLNSMTNNKLLLGSQKNAFSEKSYIEQIYNFLEIIHHFIESYNEFNNLIVEFITIVNIKHSTEVNSSGKNDPQLEMEVEDEDLNELDLHLNLIKDKIVKEVHITFKYNLKIFLKDLRNDIDFKDLAQLF